MRVWRLTTLLVLGACAAADDAALTPTVNPTLADAPTFEILGLPAEGPLSAFRPSFTNYVNVFGVRIVATAEVSPDKLLHAAHVLAQYLDNDEDGVVDDSDVHAALLAGGAFLAMTATQEDFERLDLDFEQLEHAGWHIGQDLYGEETLPAGPPHAPGGGRFDAALEEVWHLVSNGWVRAHPEAFDYAPGSTLTDAMDLARGGRFRSIPDSYPESGWYHYDDHTCDYECMAAEYFYWGLTTLLGGQDYPGRAEEIAQEWELTTPESLLVGDPAVSNLLTDPRWNLPRALPDGSYGR